MKGKKNTQKQNPEDREIPTEIAEVVGKPSTDFMIVGIGASAGGFEAFQTFLKNLPATTGMAFVFIPHLDPTHKSLMPELLDRLTEMPVQQIKNSIKAAPNNIYVIPPDKTLTIDRGILKIKPPTQTRGLRLPIDAFLLSLAEDQKENAVGVILSGSGSDGAIGIKAVKENGGVIFAQEIETSKYDGMPRSAILTGMVDFIAPVEELPAKIIEYSKHREFLQNGTSAEGVRSEMTEHLAEICSILQRQTGHDFSNYKQNTLVRRIQRRIQVVQTKSVADYVAVMRLDEKEVENLFKDLMIGVTHFFRDREAFETLKTSVITNIIDKKSAEDSIRVWIAGCSTGEEAYTIAMLLCRQMSELNVRIPTQIFATDIDEDALDYARCGRYPENIAEQIPQDFLDEFFTHQGNFYQISKAMREMCLFSSHNLIKHPPFSRLDLVSCRNLLIYLDGELQKKVLPIFHYSLIPKGFLFLGTSESVAGYSDLFRTIDKAHRIFQAKETVLGNRFKFPLIESNSLSRLRTEMRAEKPPPSNEHEIGKLIETILLGNYAPACVIVNEHAEIIYFFGRTGKYLEPAVGTPSNNLLELARKGLRLDLRTALHKATAGKELVTHENVTLETGEGLVQRVNLKIRPMTELGEDSSLYLVIFQDVGKPFSPDEIVVPDSLRQSESPLVKQLEIELRTTKEHLQTTIEELETSNEELKSTNEELLSMNEEFQSSNEELQTSKEEMQSINEEIETVNAELRKKIEEIDQTNSDLQNFFQSTNIATIFLDRNLRIKKFTPATTEIFNLIETDIGRPLTNILPLIEGIDLEAEVEICLKKIITIEREIHLTSRKEYFVMRLAPYRTIENVIDGVVITFVNITDIRDARNEAEQRARQQSAIAELGLFSVQHSDLQAIFDKACTLGKDILQTDFIKILELQPNGEELLLVSGLGWKENLVGVGRVGADLDSQAGYTLRANSPIIVREMTQEVRFHGPPLLNDHKIVSGMSVVIHNQEKPYGVFGTHTLSQRDFTLEEVSFLQSFANIIAAAIQRENSFVALRDSENQYRMLFTTIDEGFALIEMIFDENQKPIDYLFLQVNPAFERQTGIKNPVNKKVSELVPDLNDIWFETYGRIAMTGESVRFENYAAGMNLWFDLYAFRPDKDSKNQVAVLFKNITKSKKIEENLRQSESKFRVMAETVPNLIFTISAEGKTDYINERFLEFIGIRREDILNTDLGQFVHPEDIEKTRRIWSEAAAKNAVFQHNYRFRRSDGEYRWFIGRAVPMFDDQGKIVRWFGALTEIEEMMRAQHAIAEADRRKDEFLAMLGHELRNPLAPLKNSLTLLENDLDDRQFQKLHSVMSRQVEQMCRLVDDLLDVSRISHGKIQLQKEKIELKRLLQNLESDLQTAIETRDLKLELSMPEEEIWVEGDNVRLTQAIGNVIINAVKFSNRGGIINIDLENDNETAFVKVADEGIGMQREAVERIFESFTQEDNSLERTRGGLGLGLPLAKGLSRNAQRKDHGCERR